MENKRLVWLLLLALPAVLLWEPAVQYVGRKMGYDMSRAAPATQRAPVVSGDTPATQPSLERPTVNAVSATTQAGGGWTTASVAGDATPTVLGSRDPKNPQYAMELILSSRGGGIDAIRLNDFQVSVEDKSRYIFQTPYEGFINESRPMATAGVTIIADGVSSTIPLLDANWSLVMSDANSATFATEVNDSAGRRLKLTKRFSITQRDAAKDTHRGFEIAVEFGVQNAGGAPLQAKIDFNGPNMPPRELDRGTDRNIIGGYLEAGQIVRLRHDYVESFSEKRPTIDYSKGTHDEPIVWAGTSSVYFNSLLRPDPIAGTEAAITPDYIAKVEGVLLDPQTADTHQRHVVTRFDTKMLSLAPGQTITLPMRLLVGPRLRSLMNSDYFSSLPFRYDQTLLISSSCSWCTFQWLVNLLVWLLGAVQAMVRDWGIAIIVLVLIVRALLHPITKKSQVNMMRMSKFGPELERLKKKYGDNKEELNKAMLQFYKEHGAPQLLGCAPMFLQMPIWIALYSALQSTFELRQAPFLQFFGTNLTWIKDLSQPDHLIKLEQPFTFLFVPISGLNILPFFLAVVFFLQHKLTPKPPAMSPEQEQQQKMMQWMTLLFPVMLYGGPSGLNLYILASTTFGIIESKIIRKHVKEQEALEKAGAVVIDAADTPRGRDAGARGGAVAAKPQGWLARKIAEVQKRVEDIQKQAQRQKKR